MKRKRDFRCLFLSGVLMTLLFLPLPASAAPDAGDAAQIRAKYGEYQERLNAVAEADDISGQGFSLIESQVFPAELENFGSVTFLPALDKEYGRLVLFLADGNGEIVYRTDDLETNFQRKGALEQPNKGIAAVSFQDADGDGLTDILLITSCVNEAGMGYRVADVLFQAEHTYEGEDRTAAQTDRTAAQPGRASQPDQSPERSPLPFYRDWRISDKLNRFGMNKSVKFITSFVRDGFSTEYLYTVVTLEELLDNGFQIITEQCYWRDFEKLGRLRVVPGICRMADYEIFLIYLVNEQGNIVWSFQPMGTYDNLYALRGMTCRDIDGDGLKDIVVLARYSSEDEEGNQIIESDYAIYYQGTGGFTADTEFKRRYRCTDEDTMEELVKKARAYWGWSVEEE